MAIQLCAVLVGMSMLCRVASCNVLLKWEKAAIDVVSSRRSRLRPTTKDASSKRIEMLRS